MPGNLVRRPRQVPQEGLYFDALTAVRRRVLAGGDPYLLDAQVAPGCEVFFSSAHRTGVPGGSSAKPRCAWRCTASGDTACRRPPRLRSRCRPRAAARGVARAALGARLASRSPPPSARRVLALLGSRVLTPLAPLAPGARWVQGGLPAARGRLDSCSPRTQLPPRPVVFPASLFPPFLFFDGI